MYTLIGRIWVEIKTNSGKTRHCVYTLRRRAAVDDLERQTRMMSAVLGGRVQDIEALHPTLKVNHTLRKVKGLGES